MRQIAILISFCLLFLSYQFPPSTDPLLPPTLQDQLLRYKEKDDLSGWIYFQIQWVAKAPGTRAGLLAKATKEAWRKPRNNAEDQAWQDLLINEGYAFLMSGDIVHSTDAYTAAYQWAKGHVEFADETLVLENILKPLGNNYTRLGDYEQALFIHQKALALATFLGDKNALAGTCGNLANASSNMGRPGEALDYCRKGLEAVDSHSPIHGLLLAEQADAFGQLQQEAAARESIRKSIAVLENVHAAGGSPDPTEYWLLMAYQQAGDIYSRLPGSPVSALQYYKQALALKISQGNVHRREQAKLFGRLGSLYARMGQAGEAISWLDRCLAVLLPGKQIDSLREVDLFAENTLMDLLFTRATLYYKQKQRDKALRMYAFGFTVEKKLRQEFISGSSKEQSVSDSRLRYEDAIDIAWEGWSQTHEGKYEQWILGFMESSKSQLLLEEVLQQHGNDKPDSLFDRIRLLERALIYYRKESLELKDTLAALHSKQEKQAEWELAQLRKKAGNAFPLLHTADETGSAGNLSFSVTLPAFPALQEGQAIRSFFTGSKAIFAVECRGTGIAFVEKLDLPAPWQDSVRSFIHTYFGQGPDAMINHPAAYYGEAYWIYQALFNAHPLLSGTEYMLLPDGALNLLPVDALVSQAGVSPSPEKWPFVINQVLVSYGWSLETLKEQWVRTGNKSGFSGFFVSRVNQEQEGMAHILEGGHWYIDRQATATAFRNALQESAIVHISSHAYTTTGRQEVPHIQLSDQSFYLFELSGLEHHPALVVLGACRTGDGRMIVGEGAQSFARAFTGGGTNAVIAGWWNVNDEAAAQLTVEFYHALVSGNEAVGEQSGEKNLHAAAALRTAKLNWLKNSTIPYLNKLPYFWAALNYLGNPAPVTTGLLAEKGRHVDSSKWWVRWSIILILVMTGIIWWRRSKSQSAPSKSVSHPTPIEKGK